ncbi:MAG: ACT domain-containing protein [Planctomycetota bacterium]|nr:ACT domain-containing protein [Planctomycetota bacterium]
MTRRFVTSEDIRRASGGELVLDADTIVTPQALEVAEKAGVKLRHSDGQSYREPEPNRGPDAQRALDNLPHLPEPAGSETGVVVTAVGKNRPGILAEITTALGDAGADVREVSQHTVEGYFHMVLTVDLPDAAGGFGLFKERMDALGGSDDFVVRVMHERVFRFMHRI